MVHSFRAFISDLGTLFLQMLEKNKGKPTAGGCLQTGSVWDSTHSVGCLQIVDFGVFLLGQRGVSLIELPSLPLVFVLHRGLGLVIDGQGHTREYELSNDSCFPVTEQYLIKHAQNIPVCFSPFRR